MKNIKNILLLCGITFLTFQMNVSFAQNTTQNAPTPPPASPTNTEQNVRIHVDEDIDNLAQRSTVTVKRRVSNVGRGYRIQIYNGSDREAATKYKVSFMKRFPNIRSYISYSMPYYRIRVGDFGTKNEAYQFYKHLNKTYKNAMIVPSLINKKINRPTVTAPPRYQSPSQPLREE